MATNPLHQDLSIADLVPLEGQVAGHQAGVWTLQSGNILVKRSLPAEADFYTAAFSSPTTSPSEQDVLRNRLARYLPQYLGTIELPSADAPDPTKVHSTASDTGIVIESLAARRYFVRANTLDVKLGTQLWDEGQSEEKIARMIKNAEETTTAKSGLRLTGWQTWSSKSESFIVTPKSYGKSIKAPSLLPGLRLFFGRAASTDGPLRAQILTDSSKSQDERTAYADEDVPHLPADLMQPLIQHALLPALDDLIDVASKLEWRMRGGSLLIVYEGDEQSLRATLETASSGGGDLSRHPSLQTGSRQMDRLVRSPSDPAASSSGGDRPHARLLDARLIDFAHARFVPGKGPDQGVLHGLRTLRDLVAQVLA